MNLAQFLRHLCLFIVFLTWWGEGEGQDPATLEDMSSKNREYQCVAGCFSLSKDGRGVQNRQQPDCISDYRSISQDCDDQTKKLTPIHEKETGRYYVSTATKKNWHEASRYCRENGMQLAGLESDNENKIVGGLLPAPAAGTTEEYWIAGCDHVADNNWYWVETGEDLDYKNWDSGEPNDFSKKDILRCVFLKSTTDAAKNLKWADSNCDEERKFICEMPEICFKQYCNTN